MGPPARQYCPLCQGDLCIADAVRAHLIADHKRSAAEADELIARFDAGRPTAESEPEPHMCCAQRRSPGQWTIEPNGAAAAPEVPVN